MKYYHYLLILAGFLLGIFIAYLHWRPYQDVNPFAMMNSNTKIAACKGISDATELDINEFCNLEQGNLTQEQCLSTDYIKAISQHTGKTFEERCAGAITDKTAYTTSSVPTVWLSQTGQ